MDLMAIRRGLMAIMASGNIPSFMNHLESGTVNVESGSDKWVSFQNITTPKGIIVFSNDFDIKTAKADKPVLGAYGASYIAGTDTLTPNAQGLVYVNEESFYFVNWGSNTDNKSPTARNSRSETRGIRAYDVTNKRFALAGFGTGEYDFKYNTDYHWIAWD